MEGHIDDMRVDEALAVGIDDEWCNDNVVVVVDDDDAGDDGGGDDDDDDDDDDGGGDDSDDDLLDLVPDSDYEEVDEEFKESLSNHDSDEINAIMYILLPNTYSIHDQPLDQPLYSVFRSNV